MYAYSGPPKCYKLINEAEVQKSILENCLNRIEQDFHSSCRYPSQKDQLDQLAVAMKKVDLETYIIQGVSEHL